MPDQLFNTTDALVRAGEIVILALAVLILALALSAIVLVLWKTLVSFITAMQDANRQTQLFRKSLEEIWQRQREDTEAHMQALLVLGQKVEEGTAATHQGFSTQAKQIEAIPEMIAEKLDPVIAQITRLTNRIDARIDTKEANAEVEASFLAELRQIANSFIRVRDEISQILSSYKSGENHANLP